MLATESKRIKQSLQLLNSSINNWEKYYQSHCKPNSDANNTCLEINKDEERRQFKAAALILWKTHLIRKKPIPKRELYDDHEEQGWMPAATTERDPRQLHSDLWYKLGIVVLDCSSPSYMDHRD